MRASIPFRRSGFPARRHAADGRAPFEPARPRRSARCSAVGWRAANSRVPYGGHGVGAARIGALQSPGPECLALANCPRRARALSSPQSVTRTHAIRSLVDNVPARVRARSTRRAFADESSSRSAVSTRTVRVAHHTCPNARYAHPSPSSASLRGESPDVDAPAGSGDEAPGDLVWRANASATTTADRSASAAVSILRAIRPPRTRRRPAGPMRPSCARPHSTPALARSLRRRRDPPHRSPRCASSANGEGCRGTP